MKITPTATKTKVIIITKTKVHVCKFICSVFVLTWITNSILDAISPRHAKGRFGWVRRLMQGQTRQSVPPALAAVHQTQKTPRTNHGANRHLTPPTNEGPSRSYQKSKIPSIEADDEGEDTYIYDSDSQSYNTGAHSSSDHESNDNISTIPLKSITSAQSTKSPSILSDTHQDQNSINASTAETSITPSVQTAYFGNSLNPSTHLSVLQASGQDRDSESIVTLASSTRRIRRRSMETQSSTTGIPPASIMERLSVQQTAANSIYAMSIRTADRTSQVEPSQSSMYDFTDQTSSARSDYAIEVSAP
ncbi:cell wall integrity and stress response component 2 [Scheffersomyces xylosifermentans]|uniref:cell wall integrity and stress response component 2 n=1 Tax=Scheffersomyces xylosifermentans TaxID=1304137 RepID=UPI00315D2D66